jgi:uncharacterized membrane protein
MFDLGNFIGFTVLISLAVPLIITIVVVVLIVWAFRRAMPTGKAAAEMELRARLARGEISPSEFEATLDALRNQR